MKREICKLSLPLLFLCTVNIMTHRYDTSAVMSQILSVKNTDRRLVISSKLVKFFFAFQCARLPVQTSGWAELFKQVHRQYLILYSDQILLRYLLSFSFDFLTHISIILLCSGRDIRGLKIKFAYLLLERLFIMGLYELDKQSTKFTIWKH